MRLVEEREDKRLRWQWQISFNRKETDMKSDIIRIYGTSGVLALQKQAKSETEQLRSPVNGTVAVEVTRGGKQIAVKKTALK